MKIHEAIGEETWCKQAYALDKNGNERDVDDPSACKWCAKGWIIKTYPDHRMAKYNEIMRIVGYPDEELPWWNDMPDRTFEEVKEAFRKADL